MIGLGIAAAVYAALPLWLGDEEVSQFQPEPSTERLQAIAQAEAATARRWSEVVGELSAASHDGPAPEPEE